MAYDYQELKIHVSNIGTRNQVRKRLLSILSREQPGRGTAELASRYRYFVETLADGNRIYIQRPANLKNGFDFVIHVENQNFNLDHKTRSNPRHVEIFEDLREKKLNHPKLYKRLYSIIEDACRCRKIDIGKLRALRFSCGLSAELLVLVIKWFFIEQDIRYWNYSGRQMFFSGVPVP